MSIGLTSPVTGMAITGLTSPTYTVASDGNLPAGVSKGWYVTALGGTQTGVNVHSISCPFTVSWKNPANLAIPGVVDSTGVYRGASRKNHYELIVRKGAVPISGQAARICMMKITFDIEAGAETVSNAEILAMLSLGGGVLSQQVNGIADTLKSGSP